MFGGGFMQQRGAEDFAEVGQGAIGLEERADGLAVLGLFKELGGGEEEPFLPAAAGAAAAEGSSSLASLSLRSFAAPRSIVMCASCPQACMIPLFFECEG